MKFVAALFIASFLLLGCIQAPGGAQATQKPVSEIVKEDIVTTPAKASVTPIATANIGVEPTDAAAPSATVSTTVIAQTQEFAVELDDNGFYPDVITVRKGVPVKLAMTLRTKNVYFGGADVKSPIFNELGLKPGDVRIVTFTPESSFEAQDIWPASNVLKGTLKINVE